MSARKSLLDDLGLGASLDVAPDPRTISEISTLQSLLGYMRDDVERKYPREIAQLQERVGIVQAALDETRDRVIPEYEARLEELLNERDMGLMSVRGPGERKFLQELLMGAGLGAMIGVGIGGLIIMGARAAGAIADWLNGEQIDLERQIFDARVELTIAQQDGQPTEEIEARIAEMSERLGQMIAAKYELDEAEVVEEGDGSTMSAEGLGSIETRLAALERAA